jgi:endonuclease/exonuclease/phosphatase family metal-dependent hydrolase
MRSIFTTILILISVNLFSQKIMSWNIQNLGESKYKKDGIITDISRVIKLSDVDIVAIQEVVTSHYGDSCIIKLAKLLDYNFIISEKTSGSGSERYAFLYRKDIQLDWYRLDTNLKDSINREPFTAQFSINNRYFIIRQFHLVPTAKNPKKEVAKLKYIDGILCGDFNLSCNNSIFDNLKSVYQSPLCGRGTSLKRDGSVGHNNYDHFFIDKTFTILSSQVYLYPFDYNRNILSDHLPIIVSLKRKLIYK